MRSICLTAKKKTNIKESKHHLFIEMVDLLGYVIDAKGIYIDQGKVDIVTKWPEPCNLIEIQVVSGLIYFFLTTYI